MPTSAVANVVIGPGSRAFLKPFGASLSEMRVMSSAPSFSVNTAKVGTGKGGIVSQEVATSKMLEGTIECVMETTADPMALAGQYCELWIKQGNTANYYYSAEVLIKKVDPKFDNDTEAVKYSLSYHANLDFTTTTVVPA